MKRIVSAVLALCMLVSICAVPALAEEAVAMGKVETKDVITITVDGAYVDCAKYGQVPVIVEGRTLVPLRSVFEALGATVEWNNETRSVNSVKGDITISLAVDSKEMVVNGIAKTLDVPAQIMNERTMVPVRAVAEAFGCVVFWENVTRTVVITNPTYENTPEGVALAYLEACTELDVYAIMSMVTLPSAFESYIEKGMVDIKSVIDVTYEQMGLREYLNDAVYEKFLNVMTSVTQKVLDKSTYELGEYEYFSEDEIKINAIMRAPDTSVLSVEAVNAIQEEIATIENLEEGQEISDEKWFEIIDIIEKVLTEKSEELEMTETVGEVPVVKRDGRWLVYVG